MLKVVTTSLTKEFAPMIRNLLGMLPQYYEFCGEVRNKEEIIPFLNKKDVDIIFMEYDFVKDSFEVMQSVRSVFPLTAVVVLSRSDSIEDVRKCFMQGASDYLLFEKADKDYLIQLYKKQSEERGRAYGNHVKQIAENEFLYELLSEKELSLEEIRSKMKEYNVRLADRAIGCVMIKIPENTGIEAVMEKISKIPADKRIERIHLFWLYNPKRLVILFNIVHNSFLYQNYSYGEYVSELFEAVSLPMGISNIFGGISGLQEAVRQARRALADILYDKNGEAAMGRVNSIRQKTESEKIAEAYGRVENMLDRKEHSKLKDSADLFLDEAKRAHRKCPIETMEFMRKLLKKLERTYWGETEPEGIRKRKAEVHYEEGKNFSEIAEGIRKETKRLSESAKEFSPAVRGILEYLEENYATVESMQEIAEKLNYNADYLYRIFKTEVKVSFVDYLTKLRIEKGAELLLDKTRSISEIAEQVGYANNGYFARRFRELYGETPGQWRKSHKL